MRVTLRTDSIEDYDRFLRIKALPSYRFEGHDGVFDDQYAERVGLDADIATEIEYEPSEFLFDYQRDIAATCVRMGKFCVFADCGLGKTLIFLDYIRHVDAVLPADRKILIVSPLMVIGQTMAECHKFYGNRIGLGQVKASELAEWLNSSNGPRIGITNYDALTDDLSSDRLGALVLDESSMLKSHYGKWGRTCLRLGAGLKYKMACTGTPAPNDRIEYANHAVFMDAFPNVNAFLARFFVNRGQTQERWSLKDHAIVPFYRALSHFSIFLTQPAVYGWTDNTDPLPPIIVNEHHVPLTKEQASAAYTETGSLFAHHAGGITSRSVLAQIAKGSFRGKPIATKKPAAIKKLLSSWPDESTIIWCKYNNEQALMAKWLPNAASIDGATPIDERTRIVDAFKTGRIRTLITKPKILGFGLNLQIATRQVFSGLEDSYESYYQAVKRSNRYGSTRPLNVHIPYTDIERPMIETVLAKADRVAEDTKQQEILFHDARMGIA